MRDLLEHIVKALAHHPDAVVVREVAAGRATVLEVRVHKEDLGQVIGRQGRTAQAMRVLLAAAGAREGRRVVVEILE